MYYDAPAHRQPAGDSPRGGRVPRPTPRRSGDGPGGGSGLWLLLTAVGCVALGCVLLGLSSKPPQADDGKSLRAGGATPKLINVRVPRPAGASAESEPSEPAPAPWTAEQPVTPRVVTMQPVPNDPLVPPPQTVEPVPIPDVQLTRLWAAGNSADDAISEPVVYLPRAAADGESPMIRNWKVLALSSLLAALTPAAQAPALAGEAEKALTKSVDDLKRTVDGLNKRVEALSTTNGSGESVIEEIKKLEKAVLSHLSKARQDLTKDIAELKDEQFRQKLQIQTLQALSKKLEDTDNEIATLYGEVRKLRKMLLNEPTAPAVPRAVPVPEVDRTGLEEIRGRLTAIEQALAKLQPGPSTRTALSPPATSNFGRVMLVNHYAEDMLFIINNKPFRVGAGVTLPIDSVPTGSLTYEVVSPTWGRRAFSTTTLMPTETLTLTAAR